MTSGKIPDNRKSPDFTGFFCFNASDDVLWKPCFLGVLLGCQREFFLERGCTVDGTLAGRREPAPC
jgi:hypothetical protein